MDSKRGVLKNPKRLLVISLALILCGSFLAGLFHTSFYSVKVERVKFETERGTLSALLYMPKGAGKQDPRPVIVTTHGYLNTKEMQDAPAVEMSRRGYIVLAVDMYDHGDSRWNAEIPVGSQFGTFWIYSQFDAASYAFAQDYTKKDDQGNGYIAVSGHSMGGFSSEVAMYMDEMQALQTGKRMIYTGISVGSDFSYAAAIAPQDQFQAAYGSRTVGMIAAHYDEFFFNKSKEEMTEQELAVEGTVRLKDFVSTASGKMFLGLDPSGEAGEAGVLYTVDSGELKAQDQVVRDSETGKRIVYTPNETHPWNHFSLSTTSNLIDFYTQAFQGVTSPAQTNAQLSSGNQIWWLKEAFSLVSMLGFFLLFIPLIDLLLKVPFFKKAIVAAPQMVTAPKNKKQNIINWVVMAVCALLPAVLFITLFNKSEQGLRTFSYIIFVLLALCAAWVAAAWAKAGKDMHKRKDALQATKGGCVMLAIAGALLVCVLAAASIFPLGSYFNQPTTNQVVYWATISGLIAAFTAVATYYISKKKDGTEFSAYGIVFKPVVILASLATAVVAVVGAYGVVWLMQAIFTTDPRIWTLAVRTFTWDHVVAMLRYLPFFLVYYFANTVVINANTRGMKKGGYALAIGMNIGGLVLWLALQYGSVFLTGTGAFPTEALNGILLIALTPCLGIAAVYAKKLFDKTGNVWLAAFVNTLLFTMITVANTVMFWNIV